IASTGTAGEDDEVTIGAFSSGNASQLGFAASATITANGADAGGGTVTAKTVDALVAEINSNTSLNSAIRASNDNGKLRIENLSTEDLSVVGVSTTSGDITGGTGSSNTTTVGGNDVRKNLVKQFNEL